MAKLSEHVGTLDKVLSVLGKLGLWAPTAAGTVSGAIFASWSALMTLSAPLIGLCGLFGAAGGLWLYLGITDLLQRSRPDFEAWDHVEALTIAQAASLWAECDPAGVVDNKKAYPWLRMLKEQAEVGVLDVDNPRQINMHSMVLRRDLRNLEPAKKLRPKFLFPEER